MTDLKPAHNRSIRRTALPWICSILLLCGISADRMLLDRPTMDTESYHNQILAAAEDAPYHFGSWLGVEATVPQAAISLLKPNVIMSRSFREMSGNRSATFLIVQCKDARDMLGHYPPECYKGNGWVLQTATPRDWTLDGVKIHGTRYKFLTRADGEGQLVIIDNFMLLPNGRTAPDMDEVDRSARDPALKLFGAGQVQIMYSHALSDADRNEVFGAFTQGFKGLINAILRPTTEKLP